MKLLADIMSIYNLSDILRHSTSEDRKVTKWNIFCVLSLNIQVS